MPIPHSVARFNKRFTNHVLTPIVTRLPWFVVVQHIGRSSGKTYRTPVAAFKHYDGLVIALTYGPDTQWVKNVLANNGCLIDRRGEIVEMTSPRLIHDPQRRLVPFVVRLPLRILNAPDVLVLDPAK
jgi:deazaflavin-dependent oxidoreductase (nitroreductase family)